MSVHDELLPSAPDPFERPGWTGDEIAKGVTEMRREWPHVTYRRTHPSVHFHYWQDDDDADRRGYGVTDLVCHGCNRATRVIWPASMIAPGKKDELRPFADAFDAEHTGHWSIGGEMLCPPLYSLTKTLDLREPSR